MGMQACGRPVFCGVEVEAPAPRDSDAGPPVQTLLFAALAAFSAPSGLMATMALGEAAGLLLAAAAGAGVGAAGGLVVTGLTGDFGGDDSGLI